MFKKVVAGGVAHDMPADLRKVLISSRKALAAWDDITPLARNEWICWTVTVKNPETRKNHIERTVSELAEGIRRPSCWVVCLLRTDTARSPTPQWVAGWSSSK